MSESFVSIPLADLRRGVRLSVPIFDGNAEGDVLLLNRGIVLTAATIDRLKARGVSCVRVDARHAASLKGIAPKPRPLSAGPPVPRPALPFGPRIFPADAMAHQVHRSRGVPESPEQVEQFDETVRAAEARVDAIFQSVAGGTGVPGRSVKQFADDAVAQLLGDFDLFVRLGVKVDLADQSAPMHGVRVARLAMAVGTVAGLNRERVLHLGMGCLIADAGMTGIDEAVRHAPRRLDPIEFLEITKHPAKTFDMLARCDDIPSEARLVAYQMHERWNGSGYPRGRVGAQIQPLARLAAVADVFVALVSPRPWRAAHSAATAMRQIMTDTQQGLFDPAAARALLETLSLFPVGSVVELSDGRLARVVASNLDACGRPIVEAWFEATTTPPERVDLLEDESLRIVAVRANADQITAVA